MHDLVMSHRPRLAAAAVLAAFMTLALWVAAAPIGSATPNNPDAGTSVTPSGSNGVNHNDEPPAANPDCTNTPGTSGECSSPQPPSNADDNNTGANDPNTDNNYTSTRDGAPSDNGSDNGNATGQPCAGCVGRADNKNPTGQAPSGPIDHNNGYECDGNNGIGQTNPAHTGCEGDVADASTTTSCTGTAACAKNDSHRSDFDSFGCVDTAVATCSSARNADTVSSSDVLASRGISGLAAFSTRTTSAERPAEVLGATITRGTGVLGAALARTGTDLRALGTASLVLMVAGAVLILRGRRRLAQALPPVS